MSRQHGHGSGLSLTILRQFWMPHEGMEVNLSSSSECIFFFPTAWPTTHCYTHPLVQAQNLMRNSSASFSMGGGGMGGWGGCGKLIFLLREIDVICSALHCLRTIRANSLFSADQAVCWCVCLCPRMCLCVGIRVSQQQTVSIKERNCSIILATATNQLAHLCPSQLLERTWTNSAGTRGTGCLFVRCISPAE